MSTLHLVALCWLTVVYPSSSDQVVLIGDLDGDQAPEVVASGNHVDQRDAFSLFANRGDGTFASERLVASAFGERLEDIGDLDRDGLPDLLASNYWANGIALHRGLGALQFGDGAASGTATHGGPTRILDYDRDGLADIVSFSFGSGNPVRIHLFRGRADGTFDSKTTLDTALAIAASPSIRIRDGAPEILAAMHSAQLALLRLASGGVSIATLPAGPGFDLASTFADVNGDGIADIIDTNDGGSSGIFITLGKPDGGFLERRELAQPRKAALPVDVQAADFDGDGHTDLVVSDFRTPRLYYFRGDGTGNFAEGIAIDARGPVNDFAIGDLNGDSRPDLVTANDDHTVSVITNHALCRPRGRAVRH